MSQPLLAIVGPTASGKTGASIKIAEQLGGEIICADSRTIYQGMDVGTAKPTEAEQDQIPHHLLDMVDPDQMYTVADFQRDAQSAAAGIRERGKLPIVVGGSGLYVNALLYDYSFRPTGDTDEDLQVFELTALQERVDRLGISLNPSDYQNPRRLIRAIEGAGSVPEQKALPATTYIIGINPGLEVLEQRIEDRTTGWLSQGLEEETEWLHNRYGEVEPLNTTPYREVISHLFGNIQANDARELINTHLRQLAKRQLTWFKRNPDIHWVETPEDAILAATDWQNTL